MDHRILKPPMLRSAGRLGLLCSILGPAGDSVCYSTQIQSSPDKMISHTWAVLRSSPPHQYYRMLLDVVAFTGNVAGHNPPTAQSDPRHLPRRRIGLLRLDRRYLETHALHFRAIDKRWRHAFPGLLALSTPAPDLVVCCLGMLGAAEVLMLRRALIDLRSQWTLE